MQNNNYVSSPCVSVEDLMHLACSSVFCGGGTNQELAHHCLYECKGDIMVSTENAALTDEALIQCLEAASCTARALLVRARQLFRLSSP